MKNSIGSFLNNLSTALSIGGAFVIISLLSSCKGSINTREDSADDIPSLSEVFEDYFSIGVAIGMNTLEDSVDRAMVIRHYNSVTSENYMKWQYIHPEPDVYNFEQADRLVEFAEEHYLSVVGHVLVWHSQTPDWVFRDELGNLVDRETLLERMRDHIYTVVGRYQGRIQSWDVVNEGVGDDGELRRNLWYQIIGEDYIEKAFEFANDADPGATLIYNDYSLPSPGKRDRTLQLISDIQDKGIKIDGVGLQGHYHFDYPSLEDLNACIIAFGELGLKVNITELDINVLPQPSDYVGADVGMAYKLRPENNPFPEALPDSMQFLLADRYVDFFTIFMNHEEIIDRVTFWGLNDAQSWKNNWPIPGRTNYPLLFDRDYQPKKAFWEVVQLIENE